MRANIFLITAVFFSVQAQAQDCPTAPALATVSDSNWVWSYDKFSDAPLVLPSKTIEEIVKWAIEYTQDLPEPTADSSYYRPDSSSTIIRFIDSPVKPPAAPKLPEKNHFLAWLARAQNY